MSLGEKSVKILELLGVPPSGRADTATLERALGYLMSLKFRLEGENVREASKHAVVKDIRRIVEYVLSSDDPETAKKEAMYMATPFLHPALNEAFSYAVAALASNLYEELKNKPALLRRKRVNIAMDVIDNIARGYTEDKERILNEIFKLIRGEEK